MKRTISLDWRCWKILNNGSLIKKTLYFLGGPGVKNLPANVGDTDSIPGPGRFHIPQRNYARVPP